jgi:hypothetical protein
MSDNIDELSAPQLAIKLALEVAESEHDGAGPNVARVLAAEVRRLQEADAKVAYLLDLLEAFEGQQADNDRLRGELFEANGLLTALQRRFDTVLAQLNAAQRELHRDAP